MGNCAVDAATSARYSGRTRAPPSLHSTAQIFKLQGILNRLLLQLSDYCRIRLLIIARGPQSQWFVAEHRHAAPAEVRPAPEPNDQHPMRRCQRQRQSTHQRPLRARRHLRAAGARHEPHEPQLQDGFDQGMCVETRPSETAWRGRKRKRRASVLRKSAKLVGARVFAAKEVVVIQWAGEGLVV